MSNLNCSEFDALLSEGIDGRGMVDPGVVDHAERCDRCAAVLGEQRAVDTAVIAWNAAVPAVDLTERVVTNWRADRKLTVPAVKQRRRVSPRRPALAVLGAASAAILLLAVLFVDVSPQRSESSPAAPLTITRQDGPRNKPDRHPEVIANDRNEPNDSPPAKGVMPEVDEFVTGLQQRYTGVTRDVARKVAAVRLEVPSASGLPWVFPPVTEPAPAVAPRPQKQPAAKWNDSLPPIERDVRKAFGFLRDAVPDWNGRST